MEPTRAQSPIFPSEEQNPSDFEFASGAPGAETGFEASPMTAAAPESPIPASAPSGIFASGGRTLATAGLLFVAAGTFTFAYLDDARAQSPTPIAQAAAAEAVATHETNQGPDPFASIALQAQSAYVYDIGKNQPLYALDADTPRPLASLTKIAMALAVASALPSDAPVAITEPQSSDATDNRLQKGEEWTMSDLLDYTLIISSNQGADALAAAADPIILNEYPTATDTDPTSATVWMMNMIAQQHGLTSMRYYNDSGLDLDATHSGAYGSARDVASLFSYAALTSGQSFEATTHATMTFQPAHGPAITAYNTDAALEDIPGIIMGKTGYTDLAGGNLAVVFDVGPAHPVVAVVMGSTESGRFTDMKTLVAATQQAVGQGK